MINNKSKVPIKLDANFIAKALGAEIVNKRLSWDEYFISIAKDVSSRSTCVRKHVGVVIVNDSKHILTTGYNGSIRGLEHCSDVGCLMVDNHCVRTIHAEANAICQAAVNGVSLNNSVAYVTVSPCWNCFKLMVNAGIKTIIVGESYSDTKQNSMVEEHSKLIGIDLRYV